MADSFVSLGLPGLAAQQARAWALARQSAASDGDGVIFEPDLVGASVTLGRDVTPDEIVMARREARAGRPQRLFEIFQEMLRFGPGPQVSKARLAADEEDEPGPLATRLRPTPGGKHRGDEEETARGELRLRPREGRPPHRPREGSAAALEESPAAETRCPCGLLQVLWQPLRHS